ncbi:hypothetical protein H9I45_00875 [Polaribacter haliotis]|uniref:Uncharacterized protein n=2 Tax=Polaribacter TaxID=52959 RepID=A0A7L8AG85_9FLAO|nr:MULTISPECIES: hypothetical protein [Polaribacter]MDD7914097.1 hypothetical protein [Polaribacter sp. MSW5]QOD61023.1 hypothetical protein H9I45_00875 [Polaribacter haliotis]
MSYINKLNSEEIDFLMNHSEGLKSEKIDSKILEEYNNENALSNFKEDKAFRLNFKSSDTIEQIPLFPV